MRLIDGDKLQEFPIRANHCDKEHANTHFINGIESVMEYAAQLPTVDAEVVVHCKDCPHFKHYGKTSLLIDGEHIKAGWCYRRVRYNEEYRMPPDGFCSYGERKDKADAEG